MTFDKDIKVLFASAIKIVASDIVARCCCLFERIIIQEIIKVKKSSREKYSPPKELISLHK